MNELVLAHQEAKSLRRHGYAGLASVIVLLGGAAYWSAVTPIAGAVIGSGTIVVDGGGRRVQHQEGGIVREILARNEDRVDAGDVLIRLDGTMTSANLAVVEAQLGEAYIRQARLRAEIAQDDQMKWPAELDSLGDMPRLRVIFADEQRLHRSRVDAVVNQHSQLNEQIRQLETQVDGLKAQRAAIGRELVVVSGQVDNLSVLFGKSLVEGGRLAEGQRSAIQLEGDGARIDAEIARTAATIAERDLQISQLADTFRGEALSALQEVSLSIAQLLQQKIAAEDRLARLEIRAPVSGIVHESEIQTIGGVITAGETLMKLIPQGGDLMVDVRVSPLDIDRLQTGQAVTLRLASLDPRAVPELDATVTRISPDLVHDAPSGTQFYLVRVRIPQSEFARLPEDTRLVSGMPVTAFFVTGERSVLAYLTKPITDQMALVFRDE